MTIKEVIFVGAEPRISKKTGNEYWVAAFLDGMSTVELFLNDELKNQLLPIKNMSKVQLELEIKPNRDKQFAVSLARVAAV